MSSHRLLISCERKNKQVYCDETGQRLDLRSRQTSCVSHGILWDTPLRSTWAATAQFSSVQLLSRVRLFATPWTAACQASLPIINSWSLIKCMSIKSVLPSNHLNLYHPLLPPSIFPTIRVFSSESMLHIRWPNYWSFNFNISPSNEYSGLISFRMDWLALLPIQGSLKSLLQHHSSKT